MLRSNNGKEYPQFSEFANEIDTIKLSFDLLECPQKVKRKVTGFSCDDLQSAAFQAHSGCYPEYFSGAVACQNILAARATLDPSCCKNMSGSRKSKVLGHAYQNMQQKVDCVKSFQEFKAYLATRPSKIIFSPSESVSEGATVQPMPPWYKGKFHLAPELAMQAVGNLKLRPSHAILDSGCMKHFVTSSMRDLLKSKRSCNTRMLDASGHVSILTEEGDLEVKLLSKKGVSLPPLPLSNCSVSPNSPFNLLSVSQLNRDNVNVRMSNRGDYLEFNGSRFRCFRLHGLYLIGLLKPLQAYTAVPKSGHRSV